MTLFEVLPSLAYSGAVECLLLDAQFPSELTDAFSCGPAAASLTDDLFGENSGSLLASAAPSVLHHVFHVVGLSAWFKMSGVDADGPTADIVPDHEAIWDRTERQFIREAMCFDPVDDSISVGAWCAGPVPAFIRSSDVHEGPEVINPGDVGWLVKTLTSTERIAMTAKSQVVGVAQVTCQHVLPASGDRTDTIFHGANSNLVESYALGSFARPGGTSSLARRDA